MPRPSSAALLQTAAISVATILGSGILGLPVSLSQSGLPPFFVSFSMTLLAQFGVVYATTELLQRAQCRQQDKAELSLADSYEMLPYETAEVSGPSTSAEGSLSDGTEDETPRSPSLHTFAEDFLPYFSLRVLFEVAVIFHFISIMSSYALGAPQAFRQVIPRLQSVPESTLVLWFSVIASLIVIFFADSIVVPLTGATFFKGGLLTVTVFLVLGIGVSIGEKSRADWSFAAGVEPFLMGTLALSGVINLMPKLWEICLKSTGLLPREAMDKQFVVAFRLAVNIPVFACFILNILWCIGVLLCVPQTTDQSIHLDRTASPASLIAPVVFHVMRHASVDLVASNSSSISLANSNALGEISTVPLVEVLQERNHGSSSIVLTFINLFVFISISVSFLVTGVGMRHLLDDLAEALVLTIRRHTNIPSSRLRSGRSVRFYIRIARYTICSVAFGTVVFISASNPTLILKIMAGVTSLCLNAEGGLFIVLMFVVSRWKAPLLLEDGHFDATENIPEPLPAFGGNLLVAFVFIFFSFAIIVDIIKYLPNIFS